MQVDHSGGPSLQGGTPISEERLSQLKLGLREVLTAQLPEINQNFQRIAELDREIANAQAMKTEAARLAKIGLTKMFYAIFNGKNPIPADKIDTVFNTYLSDKSLTIAEETSRPTINSMRAVTQYLTDHPDVKGCDFRAFKTDIKDLPTLAEFLKTSKVQAIALSSGISAEAKAKLDEAIAARNRGLRVQYAA
jgi:hypothetical protein